MRVVAIADSDSYVKWAAAVLTRMPADWEVTLVIVRTAKEPSDSQLEAALAGSRIAGTEVARRELDAAVTLVASERPDVVLVATIGPLADLVTEGVLDACDLAPVVVSGLPGIGLPARRKALVYRSQANLLVLHSKRELREFRQLALSGGFAHEFALATLPFLEHSVSRATTGTDLVFAAQAIVPITRADRLRLLGWLVEYAERYPHQRVVIKVRALAGEGQTHRELVDYAALLAEEFARPPRNLVVESGPMSRQLRAAGALVTVSSTAVLEAIALGVPAIALDDFGVGDEHLNEVLIGSGLLAGSDALLARDFRLARDEWLDDNYFHAEADQTLRAAIDELVERNRAGALVRPARVVRGRGGALRRAWDRKRVLGRHDRRALGYLALAVGTPTRIAVLGLHALRAIGAEDDAPPGAVPLQHEAPALRNRRDDPARGR